MGNNDAMDLHSFWLRQGDWERVNTCMVQKETVRTLFDPLFSTMDLVSGALYSLFVPSPPGNLRVSVRLVLDIFVTKDNDVVLEHYK